MRSLLTLFSIILVSLSLQAQQFTGLTQGTRSGINGARINPANIADSRSWLDINLFSVDLFEENNFMYIPSENYYIGKLFQKKPNWRDYEGQPFMDYYEKGRKWDAFTQVYSQLPSAMLNIGNHGFGIQLNMRQHANLNGVDNHISKFMVNGLSFSPLQDTLLTSKGFDFRQASWLEAGLSYAFVFRQHLKNHWSAGFTVKKVFGMNSFFMNTANTEYIVYDDSTLHVTNTDLEYGYSPSPGVGNEIVDFSGGLFNGSGWAFDVGVVFQKKLEGNGFKRTSVLCAQTYDNYIFKLGLSVIDVGWITFNQGASQRSVKNAEIYWSNLNSYKFNGMGQFTQDLALHSSPASEETDKEFKMFLPAAASLQFDWRIQQGWYANLTVVHGLPIGELRLNAPAYIALSPRYESRILEVNLPMILYDLSKPRIGFSVRVFGITIGTDYLNTLFGFHDFTGFDIYLGFKIKLEKGFCVKELSHFLRGRNYYGISCPD
ncbi:MAG: DUF5723 family protein [Bacteroidales bacterium]|nr:DUF5723 family protein [Bacteroidales bacterium]